MYSLCDVCKAIPFKNLPALPDKIRISTPEGPKKDVYRCFQPTKDDVTFEPGVEHGKSLEAMLASAETCPICKILSEARRQCEDAFEDAMKTDEIFSYYDHTKGFDKRNLRLLKRVDGSDGCIALAQANNERCWFFVAAVGICAEKEDALADVWKGRSIISDPGEDLGIERARKWVRRCDEGHQCAANAKPPEMPLRVLDLGPSVELDLRLIETKDMLEPYVTLSHCWGNDGHFITTTSSLAKRQEAIDIQALPKTYQDTIHLTKKLGIRYLWIDSICITQDDSAEWERESARMASVYSNSYLAISADAAKDDTDGLFFTHTRDYYTCPYEYTNESKGTLQIFEVPISKAQRRHGLLALGDQPLSERGWALQERALAPRMLHYANDQMYFECDEHFLSEDGVNFKGRLGRLGQWASEDPGGETTNGSISWKNVLWSYTLRTLSESRDRLPALSGLARSYQEKFRDEYVAGMWKSQLLHGGLLWQAVGGGKRCSPAAMYRGPSWSWASIDGLIGMGQDYSGEGNEPLAEITGLAVELKGENPYGEIKDGWMKIRAPKIPLVVSNDPEKDQDKVPHRRVTRFTTEGGNSFGTHALLDTLDSTKPETVEILKNMEVYVLALLKYVCQDGKGFGYQGLIITPATDKPGAFRRIGVLIFDNDILASADVLKDESRFADVLLI